MMPPLVGLCFNIVDNGVGLSNLLLRFGFDHFAQPKSHAIEHLGHRTKCVNVVTHVDRRPASSLPRTAKRIAASTPWTELDSVDLR